MASNTVIPVTTPISSHDIARFLSQDGVQAGFIHDAEVWSNNEALLELLWAHIASRRNDDMSLRLLYVRHIVIETEMAVECLTKIEDCKAAFGMFPAGSTRATSMTFTQVRAFLETNEKVLENMVVLMDGSLLNTLDTEVGAALITQRINPASYVKLIGLYSSDVWTEQAARDATAIPRLSSEALEVEKLSISLGSAGEARADMEPTPLGGTELVEAMVDCINKGKHIVFFLPQSSLHECLRQINASPSRSQGAKFKVVSLTGEASINNEFDKFLDVRPIFRSDSILIGQPTLNTIRSWSVIVAFDVHSGLTGVPVKRVGLVVYSHLSTSDTRLFNWDAGVTTQVREPHRLSHQELMWQRQSCRHIQSKHVCIRFNGTLSDKIAHPVDHGDRMEFAFEVIRNWPGKRISQIPVKLGQRDKSLFMRTIDHLAVAQVLTPHEGGYKLTETKGAEVVALLPYASRYGLSFELVCLLASARFDVDSERAKRTLIRLAVVGGLVDQFIFALDDGYVDEDTESPEWNWMGRTHQHMTGPARNEISNGRLWFALGIWEKMKKDTDDFYVEMPGLEVLPGQEHVPGQELIFLHHIEGVGSFRLDVAIEIQSRVDNLESRIGIDLLMPADPLWEGHLEGQELEEVQFQLVLTYVSSLAVWDVSAGAVWLISNGVPIALAPETLIAQRRIQKEAGNKVNQGYLIIPERLEEGNDNRIVVSSAIRVPFGMLRLVGRVLGEPAAKWLKWP